MDPKIIDDIAEKLSQAVPPSVRGIQQDLEKNFKALLQGMFEKLDLVTRDEFDAQTKVLGRTRQKLTELEAQVKDLEERQK